jgi:hypothetical protein
MTEQTDEALFKRIDSRRKALVSRPEVRDILNARRDAESPEDGTAAVPSTL